VLFRSGTSLCQSFTKTRRPPPPISWLSFRWALVLSMASLSLAGSIQSYFSEQASPTILTGLSANCFLTSRRCASDSDTSTPAAYFSCVRNSTPKALALAQLAMVVGTSQSVPHWYEVNPKRILETRGGGATAAAPTAIRPAPA